MIRPKCFEDIIGHEWLVQYLQDNIAKGTLPHFLILEGAEGLGKTSLADIIALNLVYGLQDSSDKDYAYTNVICKNDSNAYIKRYKLSIDGGKDVAKDVLAEMHAAFTLDRPKVLICDECHGLSDAAQDVFLSETEFIEDGVYLIMLTTELTRLKPSLRSRAVPIHLHPLKQSDMVRLLRKEVINRDLKLQNQDVMLQLIAEWADNRPRTGLNILNAFASGSSVSMESIKGLIGSVDVKDVIPLISSLSGSMTYGLSIISEMQITPSLIDAVVECLKVKNSQPSYKIPMNDIGYIRDQLQEVELDQLVKFLFGLTKHTKLNKTAVINAYLGAHKYFEDVPKPDTSNTIEIEKQQRAAVVPDVTLRSIVKAPTLDDLLLSSDIIDN